MAESVCLGVIVAQNRHRFRSLVYLGIAVLNAVGTWLLLPYFGIVGAAAVTGAALVLGQGLAMNWYYARKTELQMARFWKSVLPLLPIPLILGVLGSILSLWVDFSSPITFLCGIALYTLIYLALTVRFALNADEKAQLRAVFSKITRRSYQ